MPAEDSRKVLWRNVAALMVHRWERENLTRLAREAGIGPGSASRIKAQETSVGLDTIDKVAAALDVQTWQLFVPTFDPANPPALVPTTDAERAFYAQLLAAARRLKTTEQ